MKRERKSVTGVVCPKCEKFTWSRHRHDYRECPCGYCTVDGGFDYLKIGYGHDTPEGEWTVPTTVTKEVALTKADKAMMRYEPRWPY